MYRSSDVPPSDPQTYELPFEGKLSAENRWVIMANLIPWEKFEEEYAKNFSEKMGAKAKPFRMALGASLTCLSKRLYKRLLVIQAELKKQAQLDEKFRNRIEGKFGQAKRRFGLNRVMAKLSETAETSIAITFLVVNLSTLLRQVLLSLFVRNQKSYLFPAFSLDTFMFYKKYRPYNLSVKQQNLPLAS